MDEEATHISELTEEERALAYHRYTIIQKHIEDNKQLSDLALENDVPIRTLQRWTQA